MRFRLIGILPALMAIAIAIVSLNGATYGQLSVTLAPSPSPTPVLSTMTAPTNEFHLQATVSGYQSPTTINKVVFYRNDVPYQTVTSSPYKLTQNDLGQDNYTYRARAYASDGDIADSGDFKLTVNTPNAVRIEVPGNTTGDLGPYIQNAITSLGSKGGTIFFRCNTTGTAKFVIRTTVNIPSNITLQGESSLDAGNCQVWWANANTGESCGNGAPSNSSFVPMFRVLSTASRVRFKDLHLRSMTNGLQCYPRQDMSAIEVEKTAAIELEGDANDVIMENLSIANFTHGIRAVSTGEGGISNVRIRGVRALSNHRQLFIDADYAYDWDVQNLNITGMDQIQGGVEIKNAGRPGSYEDNTAIKFLQLNCNGNPERQGFCINIRKHGGLYIKQMHHEGIGTGIQVEDISGDSLTNVDPIIVEGSVATGEFRDASMKLYLIGNGILAAPLVAPSTQDNARLRFIGDGASSTVFDCGDIHWDWTDTKNPDDPGDPTGMVLHWEDLRMLGTHSERYRGSMFADNFGYAYVKEHTPCPANIKDFGGEHFDTGVMPTEVFYDYGGPQPVYTHILRANSTECGNPCDAEAATTKLEGYLLSPGTIYIDGDFQIKRTLNVPKGKQIFGSPGSSLTLITPDIELFRIDILVDSNAGRVSAIVIRNLELIRGGSATGATTGIKMLGTTSGTPGTSSDMHFSGLEIKNFTKGLTAGPYVHPSPTPTVTPTPPGHPMMDGVSWKGMSFVNNQSAVEITSANTSNWNVMDLSVTSNTNGAVGWYQKASGNSLQNVRCEATGGTTMSDCVKFEFGATYLTGMKKTVNVDNALTIGLSPEMWGGSKYHSRQVSTMILRGNDFSTSDVDISGKAFVTSMNNKYADVDISSTYAGDESRVTTCGDDYGSGPGFSGLDAVSLNRYVGVPVQTKVECGANPFPWEEGIMVAEEPPFDASIGTPFAAHFLGSGAEDYVVFKMIGSQGYFYIQERGGTESKIIDFGMTGDIPLVGKLNPASAIAEIVVFRPGSPSVWWMKDPVSLAGHVVSFGTSTDRPFIGNFMDETGSADKDEIAIYRPSDGYIWIMNPHTYESISFPTSIIDTSNSIVVQAARFRGTNHLQIVLYNKSTGAWKMFDPLSPSTPYGTDSISNYAANDVPVASQYWPGDCAQIGVWRPSTQQFVVKDPGFTGCSAQTGESELVWGSNNYTPGTIADDDIPLTMDGGSHGARKPTAYRPVQGLFEYGIAKGLWWVHDPVPEP